MYRINRAIIFFLNIYVYYIYNYMRKKEGLSYLSVRTAWCGSRERGAQCSSRIIATYMYIYMYIYVNNYPERALRSPLTPPPPPSLSYMYTYI